MHLCERHSGHWQPLELPYHPAVVQQIELLEDKKSLHAKEELLDLEVRPEHHIHHTKDALVARQAHHLCAEPGNSIV